MSTLSERIRTAPSAAGEKVEVPEWGVTVEVRPMTVRSRAEVYREAVEGEVPSIEKLYPALLIASLFDPDTGEAVFTKADADWLADQHAGVVERLALKAIDLSGLSAEAVEAGKGGSSMIRSIATTSS